MANNVYIVTASSASIRQDASLQSNELRIVYKGQKLQCSKSKNNWYYTSTFKGYIQKGAVKKYTGSDTSVDASANPELSYTSVKTKTNQATANKMLTTNLTGIYGIPYQFMNTVDRRLSKDSDFGRKYTEKIISRMPLLFLTPGKQSFMTEFSKKDKKNVLNKLVDISFGKNNNTVIDDILTRSGRYYTFEFAYKEYFEYVNPMCNMTAKLMGLGNRKVTIGDETQKLGLFDWSKVLNSSFKSYFSASENIVFYVNSNTSISESFSNDTRESSLVSTVNGMSEAAKEVQYLLGMTTSAELSAAASGEWESITSSINTVIDKYLKGGGVLHGLVDSSRTVLSGGKLLFPEMWSDSDFSRSYDIDIKLRSPDRDPLSLYLNIIVPYIHLLAMTAPRQLNNPNGYGAPFLVRAFYKGLFNVDMGIITSLSVSKGKEGSWSDDGVPTEMDISMTIKDLYTSMFISNNRDIGKMINNTALMDYLSNLVGLNLAKPEITRQLEVYGMLIGAKAVQYPHKIWTGFEQDISNMLQKLYSW